MAMLRQAASNGMSPVDRRNLERLARKRAKVATAMIGERVKVLRADVEDQLSAEYSFDDELWAEVTRHAHAEVLKADKKIAEACRRLGIPEALRPSISVGWHGRGENALAGRRSELRKLAHARIDAAAESAKVAIEANLLEVETELIRDGLDSAEAAVFLNAMPTTEQLLPLVTVAELEPGQPKRGRLDTDEYRSRWSTWEPPQDAAGQLLTPSSAGDREQKRQAIARALAANPDGSHREIARMAGVDHHTVGKVRSEAGEIPTEAGELPTVDGPNGGQP
jgi:transposase-like protein